jgi:histidine triad (HIT) family protein
MARAARSAFDCSGLNIWQSNGEIAGQEIFHVHFHIFPRKRDDGCFNIYPHHPPVLPRSELDALARQIRKTIT